jgi:Domain of unknown function (DUF4214)/RTX calcium-binding nonapeptide repeat (4 copies)
MAITKVNSEFLVNAASAGNKRDSSVTGLADGRFVVTYTDASGSSGDSSVRAVRATIFNSDGSQSVPEFLVNTTTEESQSESKVTALPDGRFVVTFTDASGSAGDLRDDILARIFNSNGIQSVLEFLVNGTTAYDQYESSVTVLADGRFVVAYTDQSDSGESGSGWDIRGCIFNSNGTQAVPEFLISSSTSSTINASSNSIAALSDGRFVVTFTNRSANDPRNADVLARIFNADGSQAAPEFLVNSSIFDSQYESAVAALAGGRFVVTYSDGSQSGGDSSLTAVRARIFNSDGTQAVPEFLVNTTTQNAQQESSVTALSDGRFVVTFSDWSATGSDTGLTAIRARIFNADGTQSEPEFLVNTTTSGVQFQSSVAALANGRFVVTFTDQSADTGAGDEWAIRAQVFDTRSPFDPGSADRIVGTRLSDALSGGGGNDTLLGLAGADSLSGDADNDVLVGEGPLSLTASAQSIRRLYIATLDRGPDDAGWSSWTAARDGGQSLDGIAAGFVGSQEFLMKYGSLSDVGFVTLLYQNVLERNPDAVGLAAYTDALNSGALTRTQVVTAFSESAEFKLGTTPELHAGQIYRLYGATLARAPDAGGFEGWADLMDGGRGLLDISAGFLGSTEFQSRFGGLDNTGFVTLLYQNVLGRAPVTSEVDGWLAEIARGGTRAQVVANFSERGEYIAGTRAATDAYMRNVMTTWSDTLVGGPGNDALTGGRGSDRFTFTASEGGNDTIYGFESFDTLQFIGFGYASSAAALAAMSQQGANVALAYSGGSITFADTQLSTLQGVTSQGWLFA